MFVEKGRHDRDQDKLPAGRLTDAGKGAKPCACVVSFELPVIAWAPSCSHDDYLTFPSILTVITWAPSCSRVGATVRGSERASAGQSEVGQRTSSCQVESHFRIFFSCIET